MDCLFFFFKHTDFFLKPWIFYWHDFVIAYSKIQSIGTYTYALLTLHNYYCKKPTLTSNVCLCTMLTNSRLTWMNYEKHTVRSNIISGLPWVNLFGETFNSCTRDTDSVRGSWFYADITTARIRFLALNIL